MDKPSLPRSHDSSSLEYQSKVILDRVESTQANFGTFCRTFASYSRSLGRLRDRGDEISRNVSQFSETQTSRPSTKSCLSEFAGLFASIQDHEHARINRLEAKVVSGFSKYGYCCHSIKHEVERGMEIREREQRHEQEYLKLQGQYSVDGQTRQQKLETVNLAASDTRRAQQLLQRQSDKFEQQKVEDMRRSLLNFCEIELTFHAKALEIYTIAYNLIKALEPDSDMDTFRKEVLVTPVLPETTEGSTVDTQLQDGGQNSAKVLTPSDAADQRTSSEGSDTEGDARNTRTSLSTPTNVLLIGQKRGSLPETGPPKPKRASESVPQAAPLRQSLTANMEAGRQRQSLTTNQGVQRQSLNGTQGPPRQSLTAKQTKRYSRHFGVSETEYTDTDYATHGSNAEHA